MTLKRLLILGLVLPMQLLFAHSQELKGQVLNSKLLRSEVKYNVYLPPGYSQTKVYPVIFNLHAFGEDSNSSSGLIRRLDSMILHNGFPEVVVISPDAGLSWYIDDYAGKYKFASMFIQEFLPFVQKQYHLSSDPKRRAVMGVSMGGFGALRFSMLHPEQFGICVSLMGAVMTKEQARDDLYYDDFLHNLYGENLKGEQRMNQHFIDNNPLYIIRGRDAATMAKTKWYIQCCDKDFHSLPNAVLHIEMRERNIPHEYRTNKGDHDMDCANGSQAEAIEFIKTCLITS